MAMPLSYYWKEKVYKVHRRSFRSLFVLTNRRRTIGNGAFHDQGKIVYQGAVYRKKMPLFQMEVGDWILCSMDVPYVIIKQTEDETIIMSPTHPRKHILGNSKMYCYYNPSKEEEIAMFSFSYVRSH